VAQLRELAGANLLGVGPRWQPGQGAVHAGGDVNLLAVVAKKDFGFLLSLAPVLTAALGESRVVSFLVTQEDLRVSAKLFPSEKLRIQGCVVAGEI
jgi:hypothetical protein